jgi:hypothetical protein
MLFTSVMVVNAESTNQTFLGVVVDVDVVDVDVVVDVVDVDVAVARTAACAGPPPTNPAAAPPATASAADNTPAGHLLPITERRADVVLICSPSGGHRGVNGDARTATARGLDASGRLG